MIKNKIKLIDKFIPKTKDHNIEQENCNNYYQNKLDKIISDYKSNVLLLNINRSFNILSKDKIVNDLETEINKQRKAGKSKRGK